MNHAVTDKKVIAEKLAEAQEAAEFIKGFVVQSQLDEKGNFGECFYTYITNQSFRTFHPSHLSMMSFDESLHSLWVNGAGELGWIYNIASV